MDDAASTDELLNELIDQVTGGFTRIGELHDAGIANVVNAISSVTSTSQPEVTEVEGLQRGIEVIGAEGFVLCCLLAMCCGLMAWKIFSGAWR